MYDSPIKLIKYDSLINHTELGFLEITRKINEQTDESIYNAVLKVGIHVDKEELRKALEYDRDQYEAGYQDGLRSGFHAEYTIDGVRCANCKYYHQGVVTRCTNPNGLKSPSDDAYCSYGKQKGGDDESTV